MSLFTEIPHHTGLNWMILNPSKRLANQIQIFSGHLDVEKCTSAKKFEIRHNLNQESGGPMF